MPNAAADRAYANGDFIDGAADFPPRWAAKAAMFRAQLGPRARLDLPFGSGERLRLDLFLPETSPRGLMMFIHGGYWLAFGRRDWSHLAAGALARGYACAMPSYTLAPQARIAQITAEMEEALNAAAHLVAGPITVTGHSAGGHLAARLANAGMGGDAGARIATCVPISPVAELAPLMDTTMNTDLRLDAPECARESPARLPLRAGINAHIWVGAQERPAFVWQARTLSEEWACPWTPAPLRHHFDVIDDLENPASALMTLCAP
ncbi:MAG: alpha/beta hydrolase [Cypionkella sp.]|nr:alpha/beta hydrolase [Cypionkella sp.]